MIALMSMNPFVYGENLDDLSVNNHQSTPTQYTHKSHYPTNEDIEPEEENDSLEKNVLFKPSKHKKQRQKSKDSNDHNDRPQKVHYEGENLKVALGKKPTKKRSPNKNAKSILKDDPVPNGLTLTDLEKNVMSPYEAFTPHAEHAQVISGESEENSELMNSSEDSEDSEAT